MSKPSVWVFDLDNTLYPVSEIYDAIGERMTDFIAHALHLPRDEAHRLREHYFHECGATVTGLARHHGLDARAFLAHAHDVDYSVLRADPELATLIEALPGRRIIFTNGGAGHGQRALAQLGLTQCFERVFDIEDAGLSPKPERVAYERLIEGCRFAAQDAVLIEDTLKNLEPAHDLGFRTVLVGAVHPEPRPAYVDQWAADVKAYLRGLTA